MAKSVILDKMAKKFTANKKARIAKRAKTAKKAKMTEVSMLINSAKVAIGASRAKFARTT